MDDNDRARHAATHRRGLIKRLQAGDAGAGRAMLQHAMVAMRRAAAGVDAADEVALLWMADAVAEALDGMTLARAVGIERTRGRPAQSTPRRIVEAVPIWQAVNDLAETLRAQGVQAPRREAQRRVGIRVGKKPSTIREACALVDRLMGEQSQSE